MKVYEAIKRQAIEQAKRATDFSAMSTSYIFEGRIADAKIASDMSIEALQNGNALKAVLDGMPAELAEREI